MVRIAPFCNTYYKLELEVAIVHLYVYQAKLALKLNLKTKQFTMKFSIKNFFGKCN